jgi:hypothetical protein
VLEEARSDDRSRPITPMRITLRSGPHWIERHIEIDSRLDPQLEQDTVVAVMEGMIFRLRARVTTPPAAWQWGFTRLEDS